MISDRMTKLLTASAAELRQGIPPLGHAFLVEHDVTMDEAYSLSDLLAIGCDLLKELDKTSDGQKLMGVAIGDAELG